MRIYPKIILTIWLAICLVFFSQVALAQNIDDLKLDIYSKLGDRHCGGRMSLDKCNCPDAREMKAYIDALLETGLNKEEIFYRVAKKFSLVTILDKDIRLRVEKRMLKESGINHPRISLDSTYFDFGRLSKKQGRVSTVFKISNKGKANLVIKKIEVSCPCTFVSLTVNKNKTPYFGSDGPPEGWKAEIKPGGKGELEVMLDLQHPHIKVGKIVREVTVINNDSLYPEITLRVEAEVEE